MLMSGKIDVLYHLWRERGTLGMPSYLAHRVERLFRRRVLRQRTQIKCVHRQVMELDLFDEGISRELLHCDVRERETLIILNRMLREGMTVLDVGANIGYYVLLEADLVGEHGFVYAVEPAPGNVQRLSHNVALNGLTHRVQILPLGIASHDGVMNLYLSDQCNLHTFYPLDADAIDDHAPTTAAPTTPVQMKTISELAATLPRAIDLIRMDIEGFEVEAIEGMASLLQGGVRPAILFEAHPQAYREPDHSLRGALLQLEQLGYSPRFVASTRHAMTESSFARHGYRPQQVLWTGADQRGLYADLSMCDLIELLREGCVRTVCLATRECN